MGGCISTVDRSGKERSDLIDKQIEEDCKRFKRECKILLLGAGESGKSTIVKQMKIIHQDGFSDTELAEYRPVVYKNVLDSAQQVVVYMKKIGFECVEYSNRVHPPLLSPFLVYFHSCLSDTFIPKALADEVLDFRLDTTSSAPYFPPEIAEAIHKLWKDSIIPKMMDGHSSDFYLMDSAAYFFEEVLRIGSPGYLPNETDVLRARRKSEAITETRFTMGQLSGTHYPSGRIHMFDVGGQRSERTKWIHCFESVTSIIFCTALSEYDQVLLEEKTQNRMQESLILFESVINSRWFLRTSIILFLNKIDVFKNKVPKVSLERYFPDYHGGPDINKAAKYILWKFMQANRARLSIYPHLTQATDTMNIRLVFAAVKETILQNALKDSGIL
ncbi:heterotrimeric G-protein alpha subunit, GPA3-like protein [Flammula alnicola]|nr:heterotrimeric G-protein alpha subunit, GPA3-like protein [Flammula alnicola]